jgi:hypothetical protein
VIAPAMRQHNCKIVQVTTRIRLIFNKNKR